MKIDISENGAFQILRIEEEMNIISDLSELKFLISGYINQGKRFIALSFTNTSYIYSGAIAVLVECYKQIKKNSGQLCLVETQKEILTIFEYLKLDQLIPIYSSIDDLPDKLELTGVKSV